MTIDDAIALAAMRDAKIWRTCDGDTTPDTLRAQALDLLACEVERLRAENERLEGARASDADTLNQALRENYGAQHEVSCSPIGPWREAIWALVDGVRHGEAYQHRGDAEEITRLKAQLAVREEAAIRWAWAFADSHVTDDALVAAWRIREGR